MNKDEIVKVLTDRLGAINEQAKPLQVQLHGLRAERRGLQIALNALRPTQRGPTQRGPRGNCTHEARIRAVLAHGDYVHSGQIVLQIADLGRKKSATTGLLCSMTNRGDLVRGDPGFYKLPTNGATG